jgi:tetratricopeptide (TPR) repeat protein
VEYAKKGADFFKKAGNQQKCAEWWMKVLALKQPNASKTELFYAGLENFNAQQYNRSDSIFNVYKQKYPDEAYGYYWSFRSRSVIDSTMEAGLAVPDCQRFIEVAEADKVKFKNTLITAYGYMAGYNANVKKDFPTAISYLDRILAVDPANADAAKNKEILQKAVGNKGGSGAAPKASGASSPVKSPGAR